MNCTHDNKVLIPEDGYLNEDYENGETAYYCPDCDKNLITDFDGVIIWESEEPLQEV